MPTFLSGLLNAFGIASFGTACKFVGTAFRLGDIDAQKNPPVFQAVLKREVAVNALTFIATTGIEMARSYLSQHPHFSKWLEKPLVLGLIAPVMGIALAEVISRVFFPLKGLLNSPVKPAVLLTPPKPQPVKPRVTHSEHFSGYRPRYSVNTLPFSRTSPFTRLGF
jgi:hypothetical protein